MTIVPSDVVDLHVLEDANLLLDDPDVDPTMGDIWKENLTKLDKFRKCLRNLVAINTRDLK